MAGAVSAAAGGEVQYALAPPTRGDTAAPRAARSVPNHPTPRRPMRREAVSTHSDFHTQMAQYVFTMNRVGKIVPPKRQILKDISLSFFPGAKIGVLGLNGSGKSTLIRIMAGVYKDIEGEAKSVADLKICIHNT